MVNITSGRPASGSGVGPAAGFATGLDAGFTIEAWLTGDPDTDEHRVIAALSSRCPDLVAGETAVNYCANGREQAGSAAGSAISFRLLQVKGGCVSLEFKTASSSAGHQLSHYDEQRHTRTHRPAKPLER